MYGFARTALSPPAPRGAGTALSALKWLLLPLSGELTASSEPAGTLPPCGPRRVERTPLSHSEVWSVMLTRGRWPGLGLRLTAQTLGGFSLSLEGPLSTRGGEELSQGLGRPPSVCGEG